MVNRSDSLEKNKLNSVFSLINDPNYFDDCVLSMKKHRDCVLLVSLKKEPDIQPRIYEPFTFIR